MHETCFKPMEMNLSASSPWTLSLVHPVWWMFQQQSHRSKCLLITCALTRHVPVLVMFFHQKDVKKGFTLNRSAVYVSANQWQLVVVQELLLRKFASKLDESVGALLDKIHTRTARQDGCTEGHDGTARFLGTNSRWTSASQGSTICISGWPWILCTLMYATYHSVNISKQHTDECNINTIRVYITCEMNFQDTL